MANARMKSRHHTGKWNKTNVLGILFLLIVLRRSDATEEQNNLNSTVSCSEDEYLHNGVCCNKCSPGFKLTQVCLGEGLRSQCEKCSNNTYQEHMNYYRKCFSCREKCKPERKEIEIQNCTNVKNRVCGCVKGYYKLEINSITGHCVACHKCGDGQREKSPCEGTRNTVCECKDNHYQLNHQMCAPCTNCSTMCSHLCPHDVKPTIRHHPTTDSPLQTPVWVCLFVLIGLLCIITLYNGATYWKKRQRTLSSPSPVSCDPEIQVGEKETDRCLQCKENETSVLAAPCSSVLPDCIPREIKTHEFIYFVLDNVPVNRFKELARRLNVSEQDIDRAERDNRAFADAQYQMLMVWVDGGTTGGKSILSRPLLQECIDRLKDMNLSACAESIEDKYA